VKYISKLTSIDDRFYRDFLELDEKTLNQRHKRPRLATGPTTTSFSEPFIQDLMSRELTEDDIRRIESGDNELPDDL
jgi:hypothetical protein